MSGNLQVVHSGQHQPSWPVVDLGVSEPTCTHSTVGQAGEVSADTVDFPIPSECCGHISRLRWNRVAWLHRPACEEKNLYKSP